jgi:hypothetical protein
MWSLPVDHKFEYEVTGGQQLGAKPLKELLKRDARRGYHA